MKKILLLLLFFTLNIYSQELLSELQKITTGEITEIELIPPFKEAYSIYVEQPVNHLQPYGEKFKQRIFISHVDFNKPVVLETEGYALRKNQHTELAQLLKCNEIVVEHRYFGKSKPDFYNWKYLTVEQASADYHHIKELFGKLYKGKWISTGISKGGQTTLFYKAYYPDDIDIAVPYVAPLNFEREEKRIQSFLNSVGSKECRDKVKKFQLEVLKRRDTIEPLFIKYCNDNNYTFKYGYDLAFEYTVFEYSFSFWQWGYVDCEKIPDVNATDKELLNHLVAVSSPSFFDDKGMEDLAPFMYQAYKELGFYGYDTTPFKQYLKAVKFDFASNYIFAPCYGEIEFDPSTMKYVYNYLRNKGNNILYIYGENDTWFATSVEIGNKTNAVKMVKKGGFHRTRIKSFTGEEYGKIMSTLEKWLENDKK